MKNFIFWAVQNKQYRDGLSSALTPWSIQRNEKENRKTESSMS